jgi:hypothetical protein
MERNGGAGKLAYSRLRFGRRALLIPDNDPVAQNEVLFGLQQATRGAERIPGQSLQVAVDDS